jgi:hypothetical protein
VPDACLLQLLLYIIIIIILLHFHSIYIFPFFSFFSHFYLFSFSRINYKDEGREKYATAMKWKKSITQREEEREIMLKENFSQLMRCFLCLHFMACSGRRKHQKLKLNNLKRLRTKFFFLLLFVFVSVITNIFIVFIFILIEIFYQNNWKNLFCCCFAVCFSFSFVMSTFCLAVIYRSYFSLFVSNLTNSWIQFHFISTAVMLLCIHLIPHLFCKQIYLREKIDIYFYLLLNLCVNSAEFVPKEIIDKGKKI